MEPVEPEGREHEQGQEQVEGVSPAPSGDEAGSVDGDEAGSVDGDEAGSVDGDEAVDEAEQESFPSSDPQSTWAGPDRTDP